MKNSLVVGKPVEHLTGGSHPLEARLVETERDREMGNKKMEVGLRGSGQRKRKEKQK